MPLFARPSCFRKGAPIRHLLAVSFLALALGLLVLPAGAPVAHATDITLAWDANSEPELAGYKVYYGTASGNYSSNVDAGNQTSCVIPSLSDGATYYFVARAISNTGEESSNSNEVAYTIPTACTYAINPSSQNFGVAGGQASVSVTTQPGCAWSTSSNAAWVTVVSGASGTGNGTVTYTAAANTSGARTAGLTIGGRALAISQDGSVTYTITSSAGTGGTIAPAGAVSVAQGGSRTFTITPSNGYVVADVTVDGSSVGAVGSYTFNSVTAAHTIQATFRSVTYTLTVTKTGSGSGTVTTNPAGSSFTAGATVALTASPAAGSTFSGWSGACSGTSPSCTITIDGNTSVTAAFGVASYTISSSAGAGGTISPSGSVTVSHGANQTFTMAPSSGYAITDVKVDGSSVGAISSYTFSNVTASHSIAATFGAVTYMLSVSRAGTGNGTVTSSPTGTTFNAGATVALMATPSEGSTFTGWSGACSGTSTTCTVTMSSNLSVSASFSLNTYAITASADAGGTISPAGSVAVTYGGARTFGIAASSGYRIADVKVDGTSVGAVVSHTFSNVTASHTIQASFAQVPVTTYSLSVTRDGSGSGSVTANPGGTTYAAGTTVVLTAKTTSDSRFGGWSGACSGTSPTCTLAMTDNKAVTATFNPKKTASAPRTGPSSTTHTVSADPAPTSVAATETTNQAPTTATAHTTAATTQTDTPAATTVAAATYPQPSAPLSGVTALVAPTSSFGFTSSYSGNGNLSSSGTPDNKTSGKTLRRPTTAR